LPPAGHGQRDRSRRRQLRAGHRPDVVEAAHHAGPAVARPSRLQPDSADRLARHHRGRLHRHELPDLPRRPRVRRTGPSDPRGQEATWAVVTETRSGLMRYLASKSLLALAAALVPGMAQAQGQFGNIGSYSPPTINPSPAYSPYLNLNRPGNVAQNYFGLVQ